MAEAALPSHTGPFRHGTPLLRELFGFAEGHVSTMINQPADVEFGEGLSSITIKDVAFVAINVDASHGFDLGEVLSPFASDSGRLTMYLTLFAIGHRLRWIVNIAAAYGAVMAFEYVWCCIRIQGKLRDPEGTRRRVIMSLHRVLRLIEYSHTLFT
jgi:hypothetical protein